MSASEKTVEQIALNDYEFRVTVLTGQVRMNERLDTACKRIDETDRKVMDVRENGCTRAREHEDFKTRIDGLEQESRLTKMVSGLAGVVAGVLGQLGINSVIKQ